MSEYIPSPLHNFTPRQNPKPVLDTPDLSRIEHLSKPELISLVERMSRQCGLVASMTEEELAQAMMDKLAHTALSSNGKDTLNAIREWLDRVKGKPIQSVNVSEKKTISLVIECNGISTEPAYKTIDSVSE